MRARLRGTRGYAEHGAERSAAGERACDDRSEGRVGESERMIKSGDIRLGRKLPQSNFVSRLIATRGHDAGVHGRPGLLRGNQHLNDYARLPGERAFLPLACSWCEEGDPRNKSFLECDILCYATCERSVMCN